MRSPFEFATATRVMFGVGRVADLPGIVRSLGTRALVVTGSDTERFAADRHAMEEAGVACVTWPTPTEPTVASIREGSAAARSMAAEIVVAIGGGSAIDAAKAIAALATNPRDVLDYLEVVGQGRPLTAAPLPVVAVPTTAGTGSEVTRNAVLGVPEHGVKVSLRSPLMLPRVALVDPALTKELPPAATAATGLDALTQLIEPYVSSRANPLVDALCVEGLTGAARALARAYRNGHDMEAREAMALAGLFSGMALANAGLGAVHGFAAPIGGRFSAPHGAVCAALLPHICAINLAALEVREPDHPARARYLTIARLVTGDEEAVIGDLVPALRSLVADLGIPPLAVYGIGPADVDTLVEQALRSSSMKGNPIVLTRHDLCAVLHAAI